MQVRENGWHDVYLLYDALLVVAAQGAVAWRIKDDGYAEVAQCRNVIRINRSAGVVGCDDEEGVPEPRLLIQE